MKTQPKPLLRVIFISIILVSVLCVLSASVSAASNALLPSHSDVTDRLVDLDKARLAEALHLRRARGNLIWSGWGDADIPAILYNEEYAFLTGYPDPPDGWRNVPQLDARGGAWEEVPDDLFEGAMYYRQRIASGGATPEAFFVRIGDRWTSSMPTADWAEIELGNEFRGMVPPILQGVLPYRMAARAFLSATGGKDLYICLLLHESFHAYQALVDEDRLFAAESVYAGNRNRYPYESQAFEEDWRSELNLLADAAQAETDAETAGLARKFLELRGKRRNAAGLDTSLIDLERLKEWEEGLAKYTELSMWRLVFFSEGYLPHPSMAEDPGFSSYKNFEQIWSQQISQIRSMAGDDGDTRFYYSGLAQAVILDRLVPEWRIRALSEGAALEDLLEQAIRGR